MEKNDQKKQWIFRQNRENKSKAIQSGTSISWIYEPNTLLQ